jgi:type VI protein secretion system component VasK
MAGHGCAPWRGERGGRRWWRSGTAWGLLGGGVLLQGGAGLLLCTWFPAAREEGHKKENRREENEEKKEKRKEEGKKWEKQKERKIFPNMKISEKNKRYLVKLVKNYFCWRKIFAEL